MPLINGMKMACEPCIRGHRSTKCTHANERLMVPVRKPGRPLSTCPHPRHHMCGCSSVTAAIPRKQPCRCGSSLPPNDGALMSKVTAAITTESPCSPNKAIFRVEKSYQRSHPNTNKPSISSLERMDASQICMHQLQTNISSSMPNGFHAVVDTSERYFVPQFLNTREHYPRVSTHLPSQSLVANGNFPVDQTDRYNDKNLPNGQNGSVKKNSLARSGYLPGVEPNFVNNSSFSDLFMSELNGNDKSPQNETGSCRAPLISGDKNNTNPATSTPFSMHSDASKGGIQPSKDIPSNSCCMLKSRDNPQKSRAKSQLETEGAQVPICCSSEPPQALGQESISVVKYQAQVQNEMVFQSPFYPYTPGPTIFNSPASYGSFSNPLDASVWRMTQQTSLSQLEEHPSSSLSLHSTTLIPEILSTTNNCTCGATCQCIGCAAHPYNDATQDYVRSAWESMSHENSSSANDLPPDLNGNTFNKNGEISQQKIKDSKSSPNPPKPLSPPAIDEEQSLPENDFFFVNYSFPSTSCEGDSLNFLCDSDCQCIECEIHRRNPG